MTWVPFGVPPRRGQMARDGEIQQWLEKGIGEKGGVEWKGHNNHKTAALTINDARGNAGGTDRLC